MFYFYTPWKRQKTSDFLTFSGGIEIEHWLKMSEIMLMFIYVKKNLNQKTQHKRVDIVRILFIINSWYIGILRYTVSLNEYFNFPWISIIFFDHSIDIQKEKSNYKLCREVDLILNRKQDYDIKHVTIKRYVSWALWSNAVHSID